MHIAQIPLHFSTQAAYSCGQRESLGEDHRKVESGEKLWRAATQSFEHREVVIFIQRFAEIEGCRMQVQFNNKTVFTGYLD